jgi:hypothetical protein
MVTELMARDSEQQHTMYKDREENQLDAAEWFIALIIRSTCFGHFDAHHQELETILMLLPHKVCNDLIAGGRRSGAGQQAMRPGSGKLLPSSRTQSLLPCTSNQGFTHHMRQ